MRTEHNSELYYWHHSLYGSAFEQRDLVKHRNTEANVASNTKDKQSIKV